MGNAYLEKQTAIRREYFNIGIDTGMQLACDLISLALHDPEIMGKNTFSGKRLRPLMEAALKKEQLYAEAWGGGPEADYYQEKLDAALREAYGNIESFAQRYPYCKENRYYPKGYKNRK